jgi:hypothetical protein
MLWQREQLSAHSCAPPGAPEALADAWAGSVVAAALPEPTFLFSLAHPAISADPTNAAKIENPLLFMVISSRFLEADTELH